MKVLLIGKGEQGYGNYHTCMRICNAIQEVESDYNCHYLPLSSSENDDIKHINNYQPDIIIGIHLRRCSLLTELAPTFPYLLVCGGTDINEDVRDELHVKSMTKTLSGSKGLIVFCESIEKQLMKTFKNEIEASELKVWRIPQTVVISSQPLEKFRNADEILGLPPGMPFFLVVGRIRAVKDPCFIMRPFHEWISKQEQHAAKLVFLGGLDANPGERSEEFLKELKRYSNDIIHVGNLGVDECQQAVQQAVAVINCSQSEGQALSILEAMALGTPVIVRNIPGNLDIVEHLKTGLVFRDDETFQTCLSWIVEGSELRDELISSGKLYVDEHHGSAKSEGEKYVAAIKDALKKDN